MPTDMINAITVLVTQFFLGTYTFLLIDFKQPKNKWRLRWIASITLVVLVNIAIIFIYGYWEVYIKIGVLSMTLPYIIITFWVSQQNGIRILFNIATCLFIGSIGNVNAAVAELLLPQFHFVKPLVRAFSFLLLYFVLRKFRQPYINMLYILKRGWLVLCLIPLISVLTLIFITNSILQAFPYISCVIMYGLITVCACAYALIYLFFEKVHQEYEIQIGSDLLSAQIYALTGRISAVQAVEDRLKIERHDLRHRLQTINALLKKGDTTTVLEYVGAAQNYLNELKYVRWCSNSILDATFASYFKQAEESDIKIETILDIPKDLPVDAAELSIVFANALENAINACIMLPVEQRKIICKCISYPVLMLEITNPYMGEIAINEKGIPSTTKQNHGIGTRSIVAFAEKHNAFCDYEAKNGWFSLRIAF